MKRLFDIVLSLICLIIFSPLFIACYLTIKLSGGPAIYKQERIGRRGKPFYIYKFRSMKTDAEENGIELQRSDNDPRLTRIGKFLRSHHLDELPQLWNVFIGDMAFVGYRPERHCIRYDQELPVTLPCITAIPTPWTRCSNVWKWTLTTLNTIPGGWI